MGETSTCSRHEPADQARRDRHGRRLGALGVAVLLVAALLIGVGNPQPSEAAQQKTPGPSWYTNGWVRDLVRVGDIVYAGGQFTEVRNSAGQKVARSNVAAFHATTGEIQPWNPVVDGPVMALEASPDGSHIYLGGNFYNVNNTYRKRLAAVDTAGQVRTGFRADVGGRVLDLIHHGDQLIVAGELTSIANRSRTLVGRVDDRTGDLDGGWVPSVDGGSIRGIDLSPDGNHLYIGGNFFSVDGRSNTAYAVRLSMGDGRVDTGWRPGLDQPIFDIASTGDDVYLAVGGPGYENNRLQKHSASSGAELLRYLADGDVQDLELRDETLFVGGHFTQVFGGLARSQLAAVDTADDHITGFDPTVTTIYGVWKVLAGPEGLWLAGEFTEVEGVVRQGFAFLPNDTAPEIDGELLLDRDRTWRYRADGSAPTSGTQWAQPGYDDSRWATGRGEFGFGDDDEVTVTGAVDAFYARTTVSIADPGVYDDIGVRLLADAGSAVYVNGTEVMRHNLPGGTLTDETIASSGKWTTGEKTWTEIAVSTSAFRAGTNTIAAQVHGAYDDPGDMSFQLELVGRRTGAVVVDPGPAPDPDPQPDPEPEPDPDPVDGTPVTVISSGSSWSYLDDGSLSGTAWRSGGFDDGAWSTGRSQFGFGDGDEATTVESGHLVYGFRNQFDLAANATAATLRVLADDGAAVYVNGSEVTRVNLPDGTLDERTAALTSRWGANERSWTEFIVDPSLVRAGTNTVAASVHNVWSGNGDLSFDLELIVTPGADDPVEPGPEPDPDPEPEPDPPAGPVTLVAGDATWRYLDNGSEPGSSWATTGFNDGSWSTGRGQFGFGEGDETTVFESGHRAYFVRETFTAGRIPATLTLSAAFDDGISVHLNGTEVARSNLGDGAITAQTQALGSRWGADETTPVTFTIDPSLLTVGENVLAISVHNVWSGNGDLSLEATLVADG